MTLVLLLKLVDLVIDFVERTNLIQRQANNTALLSNSLKYRLTNPPYGIGDEFETAGLIKLLGSLDKADVSLVNEVGQC
jgi:hypothetical protein